MKSVRTTLAYFAAALTIAFGLLALLNPLVAVRLVGLEVIEPRGLSEVRATYGAFILMMGGAMVWAVPTRPRSAPWLRFAGLAWGAAAAGRLASVVLDGVWTPLNLAILVGTAFVSAAFILASFGRPEGRGDRPAPSRDERRRGLRERNPATDGDGATDEVDENAEGPLRAYRS